jgi:hypothetical protein
MSLAYCSIDSHNSEFGHVKIFALNRVVSGNNHCETFMLIDVTRSTTPDQQEYNVGGVPRLTRAEGC